MNRIVLFSFALILLIPLSNSFGATQTELGDDIFVFVQSTVRNSDGTLVAYLESTKFTDLNLPGMKTFLDFEASRGTDPIVTIDGENYQIIRRVQSQIFNSDGLVANTVLSDNIDGNPILLARFAHDGYPKTSGDSMESVWTFIRPVS